MHIAHARIHLPHALGSSLHRQQLQEGKGLGGIPLKIRRWYFCSLCHQHLQIQGNLGEAPNSKETCNSRRISGGSRHLSYLFSKLQPCSGHPATGWQRPVVCSHICEHGPIIL